MREKMGEFIFGLIITIIFAWLVYAIPWIYILIWFLIIAVILLLFVTQRNSYHSEGESSDKLISFFIRILNPLRQIFGKMPIWIVPYYRDYFDSFDGGEQLNNALRLCDEIANSLKKLNWTRERKKNTIRQIYIICENITKALWRLSILQQTEKVVQEFGKGDKIKELQEIRTLTEQIKEEIKHALEVLTSFSVYLTKLAVTGVSNPSETNSLIGKVEISGQKLAEVIQSDSDGQKFAKGASYSSVWSYTVILVIVVTTFSISSMYVPNYAFVITVTGSLLGLLVIGILKLRDSDKISENSFTQIVIEFLKSIRLLK
jgi:hypothetical protein